MIKRCFLHSGNDQKSGKLSSGMGGRFNPESVATLFRNGWQVWTGICIRARMGARGRQIVEDEFSEEIVVRQTMALYKEMLLAKSKSSEIKK